MYVNEHDEVEVIKRQNGNKTVAQKQSQKYNLIEFYSSFMFRIYCKFTEIRKNK